MSGGQGMNGRQGMNEQERRLAEYLKRAVPEPPVWLSPKEITVPKPERSRKSWAMPVLAAAAVVAIGVGIGAVATHHPDTRPPATSSAADQGSSGPAGTPSAQPTPSCQPQDASVAVPNVVGMNVSQAEQVLGQAGLSAVGVQASTASATSAGTVIRQDPAPGTELAGGTVVELTVSGSTAFGPASGSQASPACVASATPSVVPSAATVTVPSVIGMTQNQAVHDLKAAGFAVDVRAEAPAAGLSVPPGVVRPVWSQTVPAGAQAPRGTTITLDVDPN